MRFYAFRGGKTISPSHQNGALVRTIEKQREFDNKFFRYFLKSKEAII